MKHILVSLMALLFLWQSVFAQQEVPTQLTLDVMSGEASLGRTGERVTQPPSVKVVDQNGKPISGAAVVFTLPASGPGGVFDNNAKTLTVMTDDTGLAAIRTMRLNDTPGRFQILVNVAYRGVTASTSITQFSTAPNGPTHTGVGQPKGSKTKWIIIGVLAAGAGGAAAALAGHGSSSSSSSGSGGSGGSGGGGGTGAATIGITVGGATVTHP